MKHLIVIIITCMLPVLLVAGCGQEQVEPASKETPTAPISEKEVSTETETPSKERSIPTEPSPPITVDLSFPYGAPPLNQEAELNCIIKAPAISIKNMTVEVRLPEALELVNGNLSWSGDINTRDELVAITANVRAVEIGNWAIEIRQSMNPEKQGSLSFYPDWQDGIYVSISEDSAEWREYPEYRDSSGMPPKPVSLDAPVAIDFTISHPPVLNEPADLILTLSPRNNMPGATVQITLPEGATLLDGNLEWQGDLKAGVPLTLSAQIVFIKTGTWRIDGGFKLASSVGGLLGVSDSIYLSIGVEQSTYTQPPETPAENLPPPPSAPPPSVDP